jgi:hypothetical protein
MLSLLTLLILIHDAFSAYPTQTYGPVVETATLGKQTVKHRT